MKLSYNWIKDYCDFDFSVEELAKRLTDVGLVVEEICKVGNDYCLDMEITANRPDCLGFIGVAREIRASTGCKTTTPSIEECCDNKNNSTTDLKIDVSVKNSELCPRYTAQIIENVKVGPSPIWLQQRLTTIGLRSVNNIVDITNYILMETGQPLHAFDYDKLNDKEIIVRNARAGEKMVAIDNTTQTLTPDMLIIADSQKPVAIAGVMGGLETEVSEETKNILLECARFEPTNVRKTSKKLGLFSDSSYRFERDIDPEGVLWTSKRATNVIKDIAGGNTTTFSDINHETKVEKRVTLDTRRVCKVLGIEIDKNRSKEILEGLGFTTISENDDSIEVAVPSFRNDVYREIDLIEEIIRIHGYDKIPTKTNIAIDVKNRKKLELLTNDVRHHLTGIGLFEVISFSIVEDVPEKYAVKEWSEKDNLTIRNPLIKAENKLRNTLLFNCLKIKKHNQDMGVTQINIFEISNIYLATNPNELPNEKICLGILVEKGFLELNGIIESIFKLLRLNGTITWKYKELPFFNKEKSAIIEMDGNRLGFIGEINEGLANLFSLNTPSAFAEIDFDKLVNSSTTNDSFTKLPSFPGINRDVAIVIEDNIKWGDIENCVKEANVPFFDGIEFFDVFRGKQIEAGKKSVAFSVKFRSNEKTLKGEEADESIKTILNKLDSDFGAKIRQ